MLAVIAGYRRKLVQNPTPLTAVSLRIPPCYRCATNSSRAAMLIRLIVSPADENRSGANQMRQHLSFQDISGEVMRRLPDEAVHEFRQAETPTVAAAKAGFSSATDQCIQLGRGERARIRLPMRA